jgi:hypothetical protein
MERVSLGFREMPGTVTAEYRRTIVESIGACICSRDDVVNKLGVRAGVMMMPHAAVKEQSNSFTANAKTTGGPLEALGTISEAVAVGGPRVGAPSRRPAGAQGTAARVRRPAAVLWWRRRRWGRLAVVCEHALVATCEPANRRRVNEPNSHVHGVISTLSCTCFSVVVKLWAR